jgi:hypothetical protein
VLNFNLQVLKNWDYVLPLSVNFGFSTDLCAILRMYFLPTDALQYRAKLSCTGWPRLGYVAYSEGQVFGGNHSEIGTNNQRRPIWPRNDRNNFSMIVEISEAVMVLEMS